MISGVIGEIGSSVVFCNQTARNRHLYSWKPCTGTKETNVNFLQASKATMGRNVSYFNYCVYSITHFAMNATSVLKVKIGLFEKDKEIGTSAYKGLHTITKLLTIGYSCSLMQCIK